MDITDIIRKRLSNNKADRTLEETLLNEKFKRHKSGKYEISLRQEIPDNSLDFSSDDYVCAVIDDSVDLPFLFDKNILRHAKKIVTKGMDGEEKARAIFDWVEKNIEYKDSTNPRIRYRNSVEAYQERAGICGSMAYLYVVLARLNNLKSKTVHVSRDYRNRKVCHGCAVVFLDKKQILVDPAYHSFDINHREYTILSDNEMFQRFRRWRYSN